MATQAEPMGVTDDRCPNCGAVQGVFCQQCGQKRTDPADLTVGRFLRDTLHELTDLDSKLFRTFIALLFRPGHLTVEYLAGRKERYLAPIKLYLSISAAYFFFAWEADLKIGDFEQQLKQSPIFAHLAPSAGGLQDFYFERFLEKSGDYSAFPRFASVIFLGFMLFVLYYRTRRLYVEHLIFAFHYYAMDFCFFTLLTLPLMAYGALTGGRPPGWIFNAASLVLLVYLYLALKRVYQESVPRTLLKTAALFIGDIVLTTVATIVAVGFAYLAVYVI